MGLAESIIFAAVMAIGEELEEQERRKEAETQYTSNFEYKEPVTPSYGFQYKRRLYSLAQEMIDAADRECRTQSDITAADLIPNMLCGTIYEAIASLPHSISTKISLYNFSVQFCDVEDESFPAEFLFGDDKRLVNATIELSNLGFQTIHVASYKGKVPDGTIGFTTVFCELLMQLEKALAEQYPNITLLERPSVIAVDKMVELSKQTLQQMRDDNPELESNQRQDGKPLTEGSSSTSEGCYIATSVYGSYDCPPVWTLRRFRDFSLAKNRFGRLFIRLYYAISPTLVETFENTVWFHKVCKVPLDLFVWHLNKKGYNNTPYKDKSY